MGKKRGVITFQQKASRPPISRDEYIYLKDLLPKILKIGTEFEVNLPSPENSLRNKKEEPCVNHVKPCVTNCANLEQCMVERHPTFCTTRETGRFLGESFKCPAKDDQDSAACQSCPAWKLYCRGLSCSMFTPFCTICPSFQRAGDSTTENSDIRMDAETVREEMKVLLKPTNFLGQVGQAGVLEVKKDGSLQGGGGIEIPTVGRRVHWQSFYNMCRDIITPLTSRGGYVNERCGQHFHVLAGYFQGAGERSSSGKSISELEAPLPEIILANHHQLVRRYELAMFWIMSTGDSPNSLTRWAKFRSPVFPFSSMQSRMKKVQQEIASSIHSPRGDGKYASVALHLCRFSEEGNGVSTFHIENRIADGCLAPSVVTAWAMLCYAMVLKALRFSQYGIMEVGDRQYVEKAKEIAPHLINGQERDYTGSRLGDTSQLGAHIPWLQANAREMIQLLKPELSRLGPSFDILMELSENPVSLRRIRGDSWEKIEQDLYLSRLKTGEAVPAEMELRELVDLTNIMDCDSVEMWIEEASAYIGEQPPLVADIVQNMIGSGEYRWSEAIGALITS